MEWISVKDKTPDESVAVWAIEKNHKSPLIMTYEYEDGWFWAISYDTPYYDGKTWTADSEFDDEYNVTHWMPLPEPPKQ